MPMSSALVGRSSKRFRAVAEPRWLMSYAAGLGDTSPAYFDTTGDIQAHPVFPVCPEWPVILDARNMEGAASLTREEGSRGVHATHDVVLHRPVRAGEALYTTATVVAVQARRPGAYQVTRLETKAEDGAPIVTTWNGGIFRAVAVTGEDRVEDQPPPAPQPTAADTRDEDVEIPVTAGLAHVYTECARIWNPIHTDRAVALAAGLPDIILHGTATLALAISALVERELDGDPSRVHRYGCRFAAMVRMPGSITLRIHAAADKAVWFSVLNAEGEPAIDQGYLIARDP